ncbi:hypothetical protein CONPUDRAFT_75408 [Coniophora puteana RWD-64-598 SS2]|uniref:Uncharacterized protein n=1 Tax=Coniophora puteana (strain RWD-64-598) TaxID=741705 RepID=A0A5M3ME49_CONPW|nr:uncharacterized protein CONPUDRAFT_75408 [Coniophora puteana RWD-64-598 SS2]EIW77549.1 hypothetical protein CONPUDRAFT_75408 [Coniophora puteana RWD-64-598 SS2]
MPYVSNSPQYIPWISDYQKNDYLLVSIATAVLYDYILRLDQEKRKVSLMTWCYVFVANIEQLRYVGLLYAIMSGIYFIFPIRRKEFPVVCEGLYIFIDEILQSTLTIALQAAMTTRVCALYENSKKTVIFLAATFVILQLCYGVLNLFDYILPYGQSSQEAIVLGWHICGIFNGPSNIVYQWMIPVANGLLMTYELTLIVMIVYRSIMQLKEHKELRSFGVKGIMRLIIRHGLLYFFWFLTWGITNTLATNGAHLAVVEIMVFEDLAPALQVLLVSAAGPWFILAIRDPYAGRVDGMHGMTTNQTADTSVAFARPSTNAGTNDPEALS